MYNERLFQSNTARIYYDSELDTLFLEYIGKVLNDGQFIKINQAVLDAFLTLKTQKFVADIRKMDIISVNSQKWVLGNLFPGMIKHLNGRPLFHAQLLDPSEILSKVSAGNIKNKSRQVRDDFEVMQFSDPEVLKAFLRTWKG